MRCDEGIAPYDIVYNFMKNLNINRRDSPLWLSAMAMLFQ